MKDSAVKNRFLSVLAPLTLGAGLLHAACGSSGRDNFRQGDPPSFDEPGAATDAGASVQDGCSSSSTKIERVPVVLEFLVDESTSMNNNGKWAAARQALLATFADMKQTAEPATFVGLHVYPKNDKVAPQTLLDSAHYDRLVDAVNYSPASGGSTPTAETLLAAFDTVGQFVPPSDAGLATAATKRYVVLFSDGRPTDGYDKCETRVKAARNGQPPIETFSVGIGVFPSRDADYDPAFMGRIAQSGGTAPPGCDPNSTDLATVCHFQITPGDADATRQALIDAFDKIRALSASCEFSFEITKYTDLANVKVTITDRNGGEISIPKDDLNGWSFDDPQNPTKIVVHGNACSATTGAPSGRVDVVIGCKQPK
ncbi:hypothetical protein AKJ09_10945 [Labilithrix luteola]|uniref:VWFA domain-containing protein n=1 Tax=Labilithrix luteola TaxID=1391654 RepID=A0A0K1QF60_9BACT|nr:vWA domain-containing protein [Labilithrix luteola]AKV04282.1 hypothetical protein AKJ09_10945 [Labilithrix luteola]